MTERGLTILFCLATALAAGFVIGAEREQEGQTTFGGIRTFPLVALAGALGALIHIWALVGLALAVGALLTVSYIRDTQAGGDEELIGLSTEIAAIATFALGALATAEWTGLPVRDRLLLVGAGATVVLGLLALKRTLHEFVRRVSKDDVLATAKLLLLSVVILPILPDRDVGPWGALNPRGIGLLVVLISAIGFAGYVAIRVFGASKGLGLTGLLGGLASSTAVTLTFSGRAKQSPELVTACAAAIVLASATMFPRVAIELSAVSPELALAAAWPLGIAAAVGMAAGGLLFLQLSTERGAAVQEPLALKNPLTLSSALKFALLFTGVLLVSKAAQTYFDEAGVLLSAVVAGLADVDAISLSVARLHAEGSLELDTAVAAVGTAVATNTVSKTAIALVLGGPALAWRVGLAMGAALLAGALSILFIG